MAASSIDGQLLEEVSGAPAAGLRVEARDANGIFAGPLGTASSDRKGMFAIVVAPAVLERLAAVQGTVYFRVRRGNDVVADTVDTVRWDSRHPGRVVITVPRDDREVAGGYEVSGHVVNERGAPVAGVRVVAHDRLLRGTNVLGQADTDERGRYLIAYERDQLAGKLFADLDVRAVRVARNNRTKEIATSKVTYQAPARHVVDLTVPFGAMPRSSEHARLVASVAPLLGDVPLGDVDADGVTYLANSAGWDPRILAMAVQAERAARVGHPGPALLRAVPHRRRHRCLRRRPADRRALGARRRSGRQGRPRRRRPAARPDRRDPPPARPRGVAGVHPDGGGVVARRAPRHPPRRHAQGAVHRPAAGERRRAGRTVGRAAPGRLRRRARRRPADRRQARLPHPAERAGDAAPGRGRRGQGHRRSRHRRAPRGGGVAHVRRRQRAGGHQRRGLRRRVGGPGPPRPPHPRDRRPRPSPGRRHRVRRRRRPASPTSSPLPTSRRNGASAPRRCARGMASPTSPRRCSRVPCSWSGCTRSRRRMRRCARSRASASARRGRSPSTPRPSSSAAHGDAFPSPQEATLTYRKAQGVHATALNLVTAYLTQRNLPAIHVLAGDEVPDELRPAPLGDDVPASATLETLLDNLDFCACEHCNSVLSPAAYLVELLEFLDLSDITHDGANPIDVLLGRRPDLQHLLLSCENTNVALPVHRHRQRGARALRRQR